MHVAVFSALDEELTLLRDSAHRVLSGSIGPWRIWKADVEGTEVVLAAAGLGKVNTAALASLVWERYRPMLMVFTGVAGAIDPSLQVGDVVIGERTLQHDAGVLGQDGLERYQPGHIPFFNPTEKFGYQPSEVTLAVMGEVAANTALTPVLDRTPDARFGTILTGDQFLNDESTRDRLFDELSAQAVEMEGAALAQTADRLGTDHIVIRSISDLAGDDSVADFSRFLSEAATNSARLVLGLLDRLEQHDRDLTVGA